MKKKSIIWLTSSLTIVILSVILWKNFGLFFVVMFDDMKALSKKEIFEIVNENHFEITQAIETDDFENVEKIKGIEEISPEENYIDFYCGGKGIGSETSYYGFYYSKNNVIDDTKGINCPKDAVLIPDGKGFSWNETGGDNRFYVEKIIDNYFYYESHY